jgi:hypothetical protein
MEIIGRSNCVFGLTRPITALPSPCCSLPAPGLGDERRSVFACLCCNADGTSSYEFTGAHWSVNLSRRGGR